MSVVRALAASGRRKAGTPLDTASTPVMAVQPSAKARIRSSTPNVSGATVMTSTPLTMGAAPRTVRIKPIPMSASIEPTNT